MLIENYVSKSHHVLKLFSSPPSHTRNSRWWCARFSNSSSSGSCSVSSWAEHSPPPQTQPWSPSRLACCPRQQPHLCMQAREATCLACRTIRFIRPGWVKAAEFVMTVVHDKFETLCNCVLRQQERKLETRMGNICFTRERLPWTYLSHCLFEL